jgi:parallel beta-helix repeat protein
MVIFSAFIYSPAGTYKTNNKIEEVFPPKTSSDPPIMYVVSGWLIHDVILDGEISSSDEWDDTASYIIPLDRAWGWPEKQVERRVKSMTVRFKNDDEWLYLLYQVPWPAAEVDIYDNGNIELFIGPHGPPWTESDYSGWAYGNYPLDLYGWDESSWTWDTDAIPPGVINVEGSASHDGEYYWFEFRKKLDSGDGTDWSLKPGDLVGDPNAAVVDNLLVGFWDNSGSVHYEQRINMQLGTTPKIKSNWLVNTVDPNGVVTPGEWDDAVAYNIDLNRTWWDPNRQSVPSGKVLTVRFKNDLNWLYALYEFPKSYGIEPERAGFAFIWSLSDNGWVWLDGGPVDEYWDGTKWTADVQNDVQGTGTTGSLYYRFEFKKKLDSGDGEDWAVWPGEVAGSPNSPALYPHLNIHLWDNELLSYFEQHISLQLSKPQLRSNWLTNNVELDGMITYSEEWDEAIDYDLNLYDETGWPTPLYLHSDKTLNVRFKNDGEWLYMYYEIQWSNPSNPPESAGIHYAFFSGIPSTDVDSGWVNRAGGTVDYYGWNGTTFFDDELVSGQNDVEGASTYDSINDLYRFEFRKRLNSGDGWDWSVTPGERMGSWDTAVEVEVWDYETASTVSTFIILDLMRSKTIHITDDFTLTTDLYFEPGDGIIIDSSDITIDGKGHKIIGSNSGSGIINGFGHDSLKIKNVTVQEFTTGISLFGVQNSDITGNYISDNKMGIVLSDPSTLNELTNNIIARNDWWGIMANSTGNSIWRNLLINNVNQFDELPGANSWYDATDKVGNFWSDYFGLDNGNLGRELGDYKGDTEIPHLGVDWYPLLDPSIPEAYGPLPYADWWMWGRGGSDASLSIVAPNDDEISEFVNTIGKMAFWASNPDYDDKEGEARELVMVALDPYHPIDEWEGGWALEVKNNADVSAEIHVDKVISGEGTIQSKRSFTESLGPGTELIVIDDFQYADPGEPADTEPGDVFIIDVDAPTVEIYQPGAYEYIYGSSVDIIGIATDDEGLDSITINSIAVNLQGTPTEFHFTATVENLVYGENVITIVATDTSNNLLTMERTVVRDHEIISISGPDDPVAIGTNIIMKVSFVHPDDPEDEICCGAWDWGDGTVPINVPKDELNDYVIDSHNYGETGVYTITIAVKNSLGHVVDTVTWSQFIVVYDPSVGFVTGGGWIDSPAGAYPTVSGLSGKANFGFVAKYKKGSTEPTGNTEFQFHVADLNFHSDTYQWLVIANGHAMFKGTGTINGGGSYKFKLTAVDGEITGDGIDKFSIKIWEEDEVDGDEFVIYDNKPGTAIGGGSIKIHNK